MHPRRSVLAGLGLVYRLWFEPSQSEAPARNVYICVICYVMSRHGTWLACACVGVLHSMLSLSRSVYHGLCIGLAQRSAHGARCAQAAAARNKARLRITITVVTINKIIVKK